MEYHEIQTFYQPVIRTSSRQLCSFEALARWIDPEIGIIYPNEFIPVLESEGLIHLLDATIIRQVCASLSSSIANGETPIPVSVNLSRLDFTLCDIFAGNDLYGKVTLRTGIYPDARREPDIVERFARARAAADKAKDDPEKLFGYYDEV